MRAQVLSILEESEEPNRDLTLRCLDSRALGLTVSGLTVLHASALLEDEGLINLCLDCAGNKAWLVLQATNSVGQTAEECFRESSAVIPHSDAGARNRVSHRLMAACFSSDPFAVLNFYFVVNLFYALFSYLVLPSWAGTTSLGASLFPPAALLLVSFGVQCGPSILIALLFLLKARLLAKLEPHHRLRLMIRSWFDRLIDPYVWKQHLQAQRDQVIPCGMMCVWLFAFASGLYSSLPAHAQNGYVTLLALPLALAGRYAGVVRLTCPHGQCARLL
jgi:hypothetical protein